MGCSLLLFSGADFWCVCHANIGLDCSGTRFRHRLEHCSFQARKWLKWWLAWSTIIVDFSCELVKVLCAVLLFAYLPNKPYFQPCLFSAPEVFILDAHGTKNRCRKTAPEKWKMEPIYGAGFWSVERFWALVHQCNCIRNVSGSWTRGPARRPLQ